MSTYILGIESSCDDTSASVICDGKVLSNLIANQEIHKSFGGVVPELASRAHQQNIIPVVNQAISNANIDKNQLNAIAYTRGPGLLGSLLVGSSFSKSLSIGLNIPLIEVNHMQAHLLAHFIEDCGEKKPEFPFIGVTISGGHTQIVLVNDYFDMKIIGQTLDDAIGETFDKYITKQLVIQGDNISEDENAYLIDLKKEQTLAKEGKDRRFPLFVGEKEGKKYYIAPIRGKGLWDAIWGYVEKG